MGYGGDFGEETHDGNFCCDGLVFYDRGFKAGSYEAKYAYQPMVASWMQIPQSEFGTYLRLSMKEKDGREVAFEQILLAEGSLVGTDMKAAGDVTITESGEYAVICGDGFHYRFNLHYGCLEELDDYLKSPMQLTVWKAPTDNESGVKLKWKEEKYDKVRGKVYEYVIEGNSIRLKASLAPVARSPFFRYEAVYTFFADGRIDVAVDGEFDQSRTFLPRLGFEFKVAEKEYVPYIRPQEHGSHYNTKCLNLGKFRFVSAQGFSSNVSEYTGAELTGKAHYFELEKDEYTNVRIDYKVSGIGSASCGPEILDKYKMMDKNVHLVFSIINNFVKS